MPKPLPIFQDFPLLKQQAAQQFFACFDELAEGCLVVDQDVRVVMISERYAANLGVEPSDVLGREIETFLPNSLMRQVVVTGKPILLEIFEAGGHALVVTRMPVRGEDGRVVGAMAFALYSDLEPLKPFVDRYGQLQAELAHARRRLAEARRSKYTFSSFLGTSPQAMETKRLARRAALLQAPVLLRGETGTGKELVAHAIHAGGPRADRPFVAVNVAAIPETLLEAEFFGVAPGAYTGAERKPRPGKFELADGGTLFLDEIGDMPPSLQSKLLRVLQDQEFEPLGSNRVLKVDVRIIAATSRNLEAMIREGRFRRDLFYRLNVLTIALPPLRERIGDLPTLCEHLLERIGHREGAPARDLGPDALEILAARAWPGNVRELENVLEQAMLASDAHTLGAADFAGLPPEAPAPAPAGSVADAERRELEAAIAAASGNYAEAARRLGIGRTTLYRRMARLGLEVRR
ncbi:sigma-54 interaction domain-containing protein [Mesoterricola sediminis]|uniref:Sigma-54-dependent Fis family transcriptional regulator n=1 Tax=Mesoterricola sediminis TaxID=2927980 RepID=A0AA48GSC2_9BACT|nr:sigma 54-interacting transcriptional regulator [Mesoterricola sediminis]BDU78371.1 sigma-54-dependent Fis family transcriptional regulator [Mesoterricola sediminis]